MPTPQMSATALMYMGHRDRGYCHAQAVHRRRRRHRNREFSHTKDLAGWPHTPTGFGFIGWAATR